MIGETILHYKILEKLGEGGMGEVFKAQDTKLDRFVALKFLPSQFIATEEEKARFIQEAKAASAMNHPNVCTIHDIQEHEGQLFIVMEFIDGTTLRDMKGSLSEKRILDIAIQVAEGLGAAHEKGIVHRDIKPENIMIRKDGIAQIMDFGLAKLYTSSNVSRLTKAGTTMGTMGYMSPEQVQGIDIDHRSDIFSLGVVLYELLAGESPFKGMHETAIMYEIVNVEAPPIASVKSDIDPQLDGLILECLEKEKDERCQSAKELAKNLRKIKRVSTGSRTSRMYNVNSSAMNAGTTRNTDLHSVKSIGEMQVKTLAKNIFYNPKLFWGFSILSFAIIIYLLFSFVFNQNKTVLPTTVTTILPPNGASYENSIGSNLNISPDSRFIAFVANDSLGTAKLWVRPLNSTSARALADVNDHAYPFWSPDGKFIAYFYHGQLLKFSLESGTVLPICKAPNGRGGSWNENGIIVFSPNSTTGLYKVPASGGQPELLISIDTTNSTWSARWPFFLPGGEKFLYLKALYSTSSDETAGIYIASLDGKLNKKLTSVQSNPQYSNGYMFYVNQSVLLAQKLDIDKNELIGDAIPVANNIQYYSVRSSGTFSVSNVGNIIYQNVYDSGSDVAFVDKNGQIIKKLFDKKPLFSALLSPDQTKIAYDYLDRQTINVDIWIYDITRNVSTRLTFNKKMDYGPYWSNDGKEIFFTSARDTTNSSIYKKDSDGSGKAERTYSTNGTTFLDNISSDGSLFAVSVIRNGSTGWDVEIVKSTGDMKPVINIETKFNERNGGISPNQKWFLYESDESGKYELYVSALNGGNSKWQISVNGAEYGKWMDGGKKIYYATSDNKVYAVDINEKNSSISPGNPYLVFKSDITQINGLYDVSRDGSKFLVSIPRGGKLETPYTFVSNWQNIVFNRK